jgi:hypothetical protein
MPIKKESRLMNAIVWFDYTRIIILLSGFVVGFDVLLFYVISGKLAELSILWAAAICLLVPIASIMMAFSLLLILMFFFSIVDDYLYQRRAIVTLSPDGVEVVIFLNGKECWRTSTSSIDSALCILEKEMLRTEQIKIDHKKASAVFYQSTITPKLVTPATFTDNRKY